MIHRTVFVLMVSKLVSAANLAPAATITTSPAYQDNTGTANLQVVNDLTVSFVPSGTNWVNYLYRTADSSGTVSFLLDFGAVEIINSVYIAFGENNQAKDIQLKIGNTVCWQAQGTPVSQWIKCPSLSSQYLSLYNAGDTLNGISITEIMVFKEYLITPYKAEASSTYQGSDVANSMTMQQALTTADRASCFSTAGGE